MYNPYVPGIYTSCVCCYNAKPVKADESLGRRRGGVGGLWDVLARGVGLQGRRRLGRAVKMHETSAFHSRHADVGCSSRRLSGQCLGRARIECAGIISLSRWANDTALCRFFIEQKFDKRFSSFFNRFKNPTRERDGETRKKEVCWILGGNLKIDVSKTPLFNSV